MGGGAVGDLVGTLGLLMPIMKSLNFPMFTDPRPVAGSHPGVAWKPSAQHTDDAVHLLSPTVTSFVNNAAFAYRSGLMKPMGLPPALNLATFTRDNIPPKLGAPAEVPLVPSMLPPTNIIN